MAGTSRPESGSSSGSGSSTPWSRFLEYETRRRTTVLMGLAAAGAVAFSTRTQASAADTATVLRINAGGPQVTTGGVTWGADRYYSGGKSFSNSAVSSIGGTADDALYLTERSATSNLGGFSYSIPVPAAGDYTVVLHFAEIWFGATGGGPGGAGKRVFSVNFQGGAAELVNFDLFAAAGAMNAVTRQFVVPVSGSSLDIVFTATVDQPKISAIEVVFPAAPPPPEPAGQVLRINAGGPAVTAGGVQWRADQFFTGGKSYVNSSVGDVAGTTDDVLYTSERSATSNLGSFGYAIPVTAAGTYLVKLYFAEIWFGAPGGGPGGTGKRVFSANLEGGAVELQDYDIYAEVGAARAAVKVFSVPVSDGTLTIDFTAKVDQPKISALEIVFPDGAPLPPASTVPWPSAWSQGAPSPVACFEGAGLALGGLLYRFGGFDSSFRVLRSYGTYNPATNSWSALGTLPAGMAESHLGVADDGRYIYLAGGFAGNLDTTKTPTQTVSDRVYSFDPGSGVFRLITRLPKPRGAGALAYLDGKLHYISGNPADRVTNVGDHFVFDLGTGTWTSAAPLPNPKDHMSCAVLGGRIFIIGGEHGHDVLHEQQADCHAYDPGTNSWTAVASLPMAKSHIESGTFISDGRIIMAGGQTDNFQPTSQVVALDVPKNAWTVLPSLPAPRQGALVQRVGNRIVMALGGIQTHEPQKSVFLGTIQ